VATTGIVDAATVRIAEQNPVIRLETIAAEHNVHGSRFDQFMPDVRVLLSAR
jgi:hypothetical protein